MPYTDQQISVAREFYRNFLDKNGFGLGEHSSVLALAAYLDAQGTPTTEVASTPVTESDEYKTLQLDLAVEQENHAKAAQQRDHNWSELQKTKNELAEIKASIAKAE